MLKAYVTGLIEQMDDIDAAYQKYKEIGYEVTTIQPEPNLSFYHIVADRFESINNCDLLVVITKPDGTLGVGATYEVQFAIYLNKEIKYIRGIKRRERDMRQNIYIIGSLKQMGDILRVTKEYEVGGNNVIHVQPRPGIEFSNLVRECFENIRDCDLLVVVTKPDRSVGISVTYEIEYAKSLKKDIVYSIGSSYDESLVNSEILSPLNEAN